MTPLMSWLKKTRERWLGQWEEGPEPPARFRSIVALFARTNPTATVAEWSEFATKHAESAYRQGYARGFERTERLGPDWEDPDEAAALLERLEEVAAGNLSAYDPGAVVPVEGVPQESAARTAIAMNEAFLANQGMRRGPVR
jgi:hypothetical protein